MCHPLNDVRHEGLGESPVLHRVLHRPHHMRGQSGLLWFQHPTPEATVAVPRLRCHTFQLKAACVTLMVRTTETVQRSRVDQERHGHM